MSHPNSKIDTYLQHRIEGRDPVFAAQLAGYSESNVKATASRLEQREDVRAALRKAKRGAKQIVIKPPKGRIVTDEDEDAPEKKEPWKLKKKYDTPLDLFIDVMNNPDAPGGLRIECAKNALPYCHARKEGGKKESEKDTAKKAAASASKYAVPAAPNHLRRAA